MESIEMEIDYKQLRKQAKKLLKNKKYDEAIPLNLKIVDILINEHQLIY